MPGAPGSCLKAGREPGVPGTPLASARLDLEGIVAKHRHILPFTSRIVSKATGNLRPILNLPVILGSLPNTDRRESNPRPKSRQSNFAGDSPDEISSVHFASDGCRHAHSLWSRTSETDKHCSFTFVSNCFEQSARRGRFHRNRHVHRSHQPRIAFGRWLGMEIIKHSRGDLRFTGFSHYHGYSPR